MGGQRLQAEALPLSASFELAREPTGFGLALRSRDLVAPSAIGALPAQVPLACLLVDARHGAQPFAASISALVSWCPWPWAYARMASGSNRSSAPTRRHGS